MGKKTIIPALLAAITLAGYGQKAKTDVVQQGPIHCRIEGELRDTTQGKTVIVCPAETDIRVSDNYIRVVADAQGHFSCQVEADKMGLYKILLYEQFRTGSMNFANYLVEDGATVKLRFINEDDGWKVVGGGPEQTLKIKQTDDADRLYLSKMNALRTQAKTEILPQVEHLRQQGKNPMEDSLLLKRQAEIEADYSRLYEQYDAWIQDYYVAHPMQYALYDIAHQLQMLGDETREQAAGLYHAAYEDFHPENPIHGVIRTLLAASQLKPGKPYIDFEVGTVEGDRIHVEPLYRGKIAIIDFWASWCGPCRRHSRDLIPLYEKYKGQGFTVIGIAHEEKVSDMVRAAEKDGYPWPNYIDLKDELKVWQKNGLGMAGGGMFLIGQDGVIISTANESDELEPLIRKALGLPELPPSGWKAEAEQNRIEPKDPARPFTDFSVVYNGKTMRLSDYVGRGRYVLVDFWASWCGPCLEEIPNLIAADEKYRDRGLQVLGVAVWDKPAHTEAAIQEHHIPYPQIINAQDIASKAYGIRGIPEIILFAPDGTIVARGLRGDDIGKKLEETLSPAL